MKKKATPVNPFDSIAKPPTTKRKKHPIRVPLPKQTEQSFKDKTQYDRHSKLLRILDAKEAEWHDDDYDHDKDW